MSSPPKVKLKSVSTPKLDYQNPFMQIRHTTADFGAFCKDYYVIELGPRAGLLAVGKEGVLLTRQYRFLINRPSWELPGGKVDEGESAETAAARECLEETGVECKELQKLVEYFPGLDNFDNRTTIFYTKRFRIAKPFTPVESEVTELKWVPIAKAVAMIQDGEILDALTVTGLLAYVALAPRA